MVLWWCCCCCCVVVVLLLCGVVCCVLLLYAVLCYVLCNVLQCVVLRVVRSVLTNNDDKDLGKISTVLESIYDDINSNKADTITKREWLEYFSSYPEFERNDIVSPIVSLAKSCKEEIQRKERENERERRNDPTYFPGLE